MNLNLVATFAKVVELGSFSAAAKALRLPVSSVSRAVSQLEAELGAKLFDRTTRRVDLTAAGHAYFEHASRGLQAFDEGERHLSELQVDPRGEIRVTVPSCFDDGFLNRQLGRFAQLHPKVRLLVHVTNQTTQLVAEQFDLALRMAHRLPDSALLAKEVGQMHVALAASKRYLSEHGRPQRFSELSGHRIVALGQNASVRWVFDGPHGAETIELQPTLVVDDLLSMRQLLIAGVGIGMVPRAPGSAPVFSEGLEPVLPGYTMAGPRLFVTVQPAKKVSAKVAALRDFLVQAYAGAGRSTVTRA